MKQLLVTTFMSPVFAFAHGGHGQAGAHWHATDTWGSIALAAMAALALWLARRK